MGKLSSYMLMQNKGIWDSNFNTLLSFIFRTLNHCLRIRIKLFHKWDFKFLRKTPNFLTEFSRTSYHDYRYTVNAKYWNWNKSCLEHLGCREALASSRMLHLSSLFSKVFMWAACCRLLALAGTRTGCINTLRMY